MSTPQQSNVVADRIAIVGCGHVGATSAYALMQRGIAGVYLSLPCVVGRAGVERVIELPLNEAEQAGLRASAAVLRRTLDRLQ